MINSTDLTLEKNEKLGFFYAFLASFSYATMASVAKLAVEVPAPMMVFFRNLVCFIFLIPLFFKIESFKTQKIGLFSIRAIAGFITLNCFFFAAKELFLVDAVLLINTAPLFIPIVILGWDRKKIPPLRLLAMGIGFIGILLILKPRYDFFNFLGLIGLCSGIFMAFSMVTLNKLSKSEPTERIMFYFFLGNIILGFFPMLYSWKTFEHSITWFYIFLVGVLAFAFQFLTTKAYTHLHPTKVSPLSYLSIVFSGIIGWLIWDNIPDLFSIIGTCFVILGGILVLRDKKKVLES